MSDACCRYVKEELMSRMCKHGYKAQFKVSRVRILSIMSTLSYTNHSSENPINHVKLHKDM